MSRPSRWFRFVLFEKSVECIASAGLLALLDRSWLSSPRYDAIWLILPPHWWAIVFLISATLMVRGAWSYVTGTIGLCVMTIIWGVWLSCYVVAFVLVPTSPLPAMFATYMVLSNFLLLYAPRSAVRLWN